VQVILPYLRPSWSMPRVCDLRTGQTISISGTASPKLLQMWGRRMMATLTGFCHRSCLVQYPRFLLRPRLNHLNKGFQIDCGGAAKRDRNKLRQILCTHRQEHPPRKASQQQAPGSYVFWAVLQLRGVPSARFQCGEHSFLPGKS